MNRPKIYQVAPTKDYKVCVYYDNGEIKLYDCNWILSKSGVFEQIKEIDAFMELCTVMNGTLAWDISGKRDPYTCIDICPDSVYADSIKHNKDLTA